MIIGLDKETFRDDFVSLKKVCDKGSLATHVG